MWCQRLLTAGAARRSCFRGRALFLQHLAVEAEARSTWIALGLFFCVGAVSSVWHVGMFSLAVLLGLGEECRVGKDSMWEPVWELVLLWHFLSTCSEDMLLSPKFSLSTIHVRLTAKGLLRNLRLPSGFRKSTVIFHTGLSGTPLSVLLHWVGGLLGYLAGAYQKSPKGTDYWGKKALMGEPGIICQNKPLSLVLQHMCLALWLVRWKPNCCLDAPSSLLWHQPDLEKKISTCSVTFSFTWFRKWETGKSRQLALFPLKKEMKREGSVVFRSVVPHWGCDRLVWYTKRWLCSQHAEIKHHNGCGQVGNERQIKFSKLHGENVCKSQETASNLPACICFLFSVPRDGNECRVYFRHMSPACPLWEDSFASCRCLLFGYNCNYGQLSWFHGINTGSDDLLNLGWLVVTVLGSSEYVNIE